MTNTQWILLVTLTATVLAGPAPARQPVAGGSARTESAVAPAVVQPALAPRVTELNAAGIQKIAARAGKNRRDIEVLTRWGAAYFPWPKNVTPVTFEIEVGHESGVAVRAAGYTEANRARYAAAFDDVLPRAVSSVNDLRARALRPRR